ncbi:MAG: ABC transporter permease [Chloroflexota bacterium]
MIFLGLPVIVLIGRAVVSGSVFAAVASSAVLDALVLSAITTTIAVGLVLVLGFPLAVVLARARFRGRALLEAIVDLPIVLPPSVAGLALLLTFGRRGLLGEPLAAIGVSLPFTTFAVILAQLFVAAPFFIRAARAGIAGVERELEDAARVDGATERHVLQFVTIPQAAPALAAGIVTSWARALGEFGATIMLAGAIEGRTQTLPLVVYGEFQSTNLEASIAAAAVLVIAAVAALVAVRGLRWGRALDARGVA